jgi:hypothetical protein
MPSTAGRPAANSLRRSRTSSAADMRAYLTLALARDAHCR